MKIYNNGYPLDRREHHLMFDNNRLEREQATLRIAVLSLVFLYIIFVGNIRGISKEAFNTAVEFGSFNIFSSMLLVSILRFSWQAVNRRRRQDFADRRANISQIDRPISQICVAPMLSMRTIDSHWENKNDG